MTSLRDAKVYEISKFGCAEGGGVRHRYTTEDVWRCSCSRHPIDPHCPCLKTKYDRSWGLMSMGIAIHTYGARTGMGGI